MQVRCQETSALVSGQEIRDLHTMDELVLYHWSSMIMMRQTEKPAEV
jgi:hypothetical protein